MTVRQTVHKERNKRIFIKEDSLIGEAVRQLLGFFITRQARQFVASAGAVAGEYNRFDPLFIFTAVGDVIAVMLVFLLHKAATGVVGPPLR